MQEIGFYDAMTKNIEKYSMVYLTPNMMWKAIISMLKYCESSRNAPAKILNDDYIFTLPTDSVEQKKLKKLIVNDSIVLKQKSISLREDDIKNFKFHTNVQDWQLFEGWLKQFDFLSSVTELVKNIIGELEGEANTEYWKSPLIKIDKYFTGWFMCLFDSSSLTDTHYSVEEFLIPVGVNERAIVFSKVIENEEFYDTVLVTHSNEIQKKLNSSQQSYINSTESCSRNQSETEEQLIVIPKIDLYSSPPPSQPLSTATLEQIKEINDDSSHDDTFEESDIHDSDID